MTCHPLRDTGEFFTAEGWDFEGMKKAYVPDYVIEHIKKNMSKTQLCDQADKLWWTKTSSGKFSIKSAWNMLSKKDDINEDMKQL